MQPHSAWPNRYPLTQLRLQISPLSLVCRHGQHQVPSVSPKSVSVCLGVPLIFSQISACSSCVMSFHTHSALQTTLLKFISKSSFDVLIYGNIIFSVPYKLHFHLSRMSLQRKLVQLPHFLRVLPPLCVPLLTPLFAQAAYLQLQSFPLHHPPSFSSSQPCCLSLHCILVVSK